MSTLINGADALLRAEALPPEENIQKTSLPPTTEASPNFILCTTLSPPASIPSPELTSQAHTCLPTSPPLIGADAHLRAAAGGKHPKRSSPPTTAASPNFILRTMLSPPANIPSPELTSPAQLCLQTSPPLIGADAHLRAAALPPEENIQKNHHLRPPRLRRTTATIHALSSG